MAVRKASYSTTPSFNKSIHPFIQRSDILRHLPIRMVALLPPHRADVRNPPSHPLPPHHHHSSVNLVFMEISQSPSAGDHTCLMGFITKAATAQIATTCVELILLVRGKPRHSLGSRYRRSSPINTYLTFKPRSLVHALYNRSRKTGILLGLVFITGFALEVASDIRVIKSVIDDHNPTCTPPPYERVALALFAYVVGSLSNSFTQRFSQF